MKLPQGKGFTLRFLIAIGLVFVAGMLVIFFMLGHYDPKATHTQHASANSKLASDEINQLHNDHTPVLLLQQWQVMLNGKQYPIIVKNGVAYIKQHARHIPLQDGAIVYRNGQMYKYNHGMFRPLTGYQPKVGDLVDQQGRLYQLGKDGKLHPYNGKLHAGQVVWKHHQAYVVGQDGQLHAVGSTPQVGSFKESDGKLYQLGKDGKWHPYNGKLHAGQVVWKHHQAYVVGQDGQLHRLEHTAIHHTTMPLPNGARPGDFVVKNGKTYRVGADRQLIPYTGKIPLGARVFHLGATNPSSTMVVSHKKKNTSDKQLYDSPLLALQTKQTSSHSTNDQTRSQFEKNSLSLLQAQNRTLAQLGQHGNLYAQQNDQAAKIAFLNSQQINPKDTLKQSLKHPTSPYTLFAGTLIPATLMTGINSDLPGQIIAQVSENVYDTVTGNYILIPQGTRLIGQYSSQISYGQSRILIAWNRLIMPNGDHFDLSGMPGADLMGLAGLSDKVNHHWFRLFGSALMFSVFGALGQLSQPNTSTNGFTNQQIIYGSIGQQLTQTAMLRLAQDMNIQPTINIRSGDNFNVLVTRDVVLPTPYQGYYGS